MKILNQILVLTIAVSLTACAGQKKQVKSESVTPPKMECAMKSATAEVEKKVEAPQPVLATAYVVKSNDTLEKISRKKEIYGDGLVWPVIFEANRDKLANPSKIYPGQKLRIPRDTKEIAILKQRAEVNRVRQAAAIYRPKPVVKPVTAPSATVPQTPQASVPAVSEPTPAPAVQAPETVPVPTAPAAEPSPSDAQPETAMPVVEEAESVPIPSGTNQ